MAHSAFCPVRFSAAREDSHALGEALGVPDLFNVTAEFWFEVITTVVYLPFYRYCLKVKHAR